VIQVNSETRRDWSPTLSQYARPGSQKTKFQQELSKFLGPGTQADDFLGPRKSVPVLSGVTGRLKRIIFSVPFCDQWSFPFLCATYNTKSCALSTLSQKSATTITITMRVF